MLEIYRLTRKKYAAELSGRGAAIKGGRWNSASREMIYCAANRSLAMAEVAVHFSIATLPTDYLMMTIQVPDSLAVKEVRIEELPKYWNVFPPSKSSQLIGDQFLLDNQYLLCKVPSVVTSGDYNYLVNPAHKDFDQISVLSREVFLFDRRLL